MITVDAPTVEFGGTTLFKDISFQINPKDRVVAYLPQHLVTQDKRTVFDETCQAFAHHHEIQAEIDRINNQLTTRTDYESPGYMLLIESVPRSTASASLTTARSSDSTAALTDRASASYGKLARATYSVSLPPSPVLHASPTTTRDSSIRPAPSLPTDAT